MNRIPGTKIVSLISDFGVEDPFVGIMKGVMAGIDPAIRFIDLTHLIRPQDILHGYLALRSAYIYCPEGTVHLAVVDPGVGGHRKGIAIESDGHYFVGPDNGIFSFLFDSETPFSAVELLNDRYFRSPVSTTFHGRDIFAPVAASLSGGVCSLDDLGDPVSDPVRVSIPAPAISGNNLSGEIIHIDNFGNLTTNISETELDRVAGGSTPGTLFSINGREGKLLETYSDTPKDTLAGAVNSWGMLEIFINYGNAANMLSAKKGTAVIVAPS